MKACIKFLSVLLIVTMCVGFMPAAYANGAGSIVIAPGFSSSGASEPSAGTPADKATASPKPTDTAGDKQGAEDKADETDEDEEDEDAPDEISVASVAELRAAVRTVKAFGTVHVTDDIPDLTAPLVIRKSLTLDLGGCTLTFGPEGASVYDAAIVIASGVDEVMICDGAVEVQRTIDELTESAFGYERFISSAADSLILSGVGFEGALITEGSLLSFEEDGSLAVEAGDEFTWDPSDYVDLDAFTVSYDEDSGLWTVAEKDEGETEPDPEQKTEGETQETDPQKEDDPDKKEEPQTGTEAEIKDEPKDDTPVSEPVTVSSQEELNAALEDPAKAEITVAEGSKLGDVEIKRDLSLNLSGASLSGTVLVTNNATVTISGGSISGKIFNTGALTLNGVSVSAASGLFGGASGACIENNGGALTLAGGSVVGDVTVSGGSFTVNDDSVQAGTVSVSGSVTVTISGGQFERLVALDGYDPMAIDNEIASDGPITSVGTGLIGNVTGGHFRSGIEPLNGFVHDPYGMDEDGGIMLMTLIPDTGKDGSKDAVTLVEGSPSSYIGSDDARMDFAVYYKGESKTLVVPAFYVNVKQSGDTAGDDATIDTIVIKPASGAETTLTLAEKDYEYTKKNTANEGGTVKLIAGNEKLNGLNAGLYTLYFQCKGGLATPYSLSFPLFIVPELENKNPQFTLKSATEAFTFALNDGDKPNNVTVGIGTSHDLKANAVENNATGYTHSDNIFTLTKDYINSLNTVGQYYVGLWYGSVVVYVPFRVVGKAWISSESEEGWVYNSGKNLEFTVSPGDTKIDEAYLDPESRLAADTGTELKASQFSVSGNKITVYASFLQSLVDTKTGNGHGKHTIVFVTDGGQEIGVEINIKPAMWAKDGKDTHTRGTDGTLTYEFSAPMTPGTIPTLNGTDLKPEDYVISGNTITLKADFLNKRTGANSYTLRVMTDYGVVAAEVKLTGTVKNTTTNGVNTGDVNNPAIWAIVLVLSGAAAVTLMVPKKKKTQGE